MKKGIKYLAMLFAAVLAISIIGAGVTAVVSVCSKLFESSTGTGSTSDGIYQDADGGVVVFGMKFGGVENLVSYTKEFEKDGIKSLYVDCSSQRLEVIPGDKFEAVLTNVPDTYIAEVQNGVLTIKDTSKKVFHIGGSVKEASIVLTIPSDFVAESIMLGTGSGSARAEGLAAASISVDSGSGSVYLKNLKADRTVIDTGSGSVSVSDSELGTARIDTGSGSVDFESVVSQNTRIDTGSGRVVYSGEMTGNCVIDSGSGSVNFMLRGKEENYSIDADLGSGGFYINGKSIKNKTIKHAGAENTLIFDVGSGRVSIEFIGD